MHLTPELLLRAYAVGIFPMAESRKDREIHWIDPELRGIIPLDRFHVPKKLKRKVARGAFEVTCNEAFAEVIRACAESQPDRPETWINPTIEQLYVELHGMGFAHSVECWFTDEDGERQIAGGLYGVSLGAAFFGESMFTRVTDASKVALVHLVLRLMNSGFHLLDTQFTTPHLRQFGAIDVPRETYKAMLSKALMESATFDPALEEARIQDLLAALSDSDGG